MKLYPFLSTAFVRRVPARTSRSLAVLTLLTLTFCVAGLVAVSCLDPSAQAAQQEKVSQDEPPPDLDEAEPPTEETRSAAIAKLRQAATAEVEAAAATVTAPDPQALAKALGVELGPNTDENDVPDPGRLEPLGDLDGDGVPEMALRWTRPPRRVPESGEEEGQLSAWVLFLLAWDGARWRPSPLMEGAESFTLQALSLLGPATRELVVLVSVGSTGVQYPVIFQFGNHAATLLWDARADESRYQGYVHGNVEFRDENGDGVFELVTSGRADPGLLVFPPQGRRGFEARAVYVWDGKAYVPGKTEYSANEDYTLYRFISALHLRDFRRAYALIDPAKFLKTQEPSLEAFRKQIEGTWPEFLDDHIFEAKDSGPTVPDDFSFELILEDKVYTYHPAFSPDTKHLLTGLERREGR
jgi:hypothetical protein